MTNKPVPAPLPAKRNRVQRTDYDNLGRAHAATNDIGDGDPDENDEPVLESNSGQETAPESYNDAARDERWVQ